MNADQDRGAKRKLPFSPDNNMDYSKAVPPISSSMSGDGVRLGKGQTVYVYDAEESWREAVVVNVDQTKRVVTVKIEDTDQIANCCESHILLCSKMALDELSNLTHINPIHEASVLSCLQQRFAQGQYYTNAGTTVVAVNPFADVSHLYGVDIVHAYHSRIEDLPPHIYPVAETAYTGLVRELGKVNQSIIISGESGAGKTVSAKHLLRYLTIVANPATERRLSSSSSKGVQIEERILDSNPILESFGNAATPRNNNSSRFGKFIELQFLRKGQIQGGTVQTYLLEKTRVMHQGPGENNFHIFYQMTGLSEEKRQGLPDWVQDIQAEISDNTFTCVPHNQDCSENGDIRETLNAMTDIGLGQDKQKHVFQILMTILYLGNVRFIEAKDDSSDLESSPNSSLESQGLDDSYIEVSVSEKALNKSSSLLGVDPVCLRQTLLHRSLQAGSRSRKSIFVKPIGIQEARSRRDCLAMLLYSRLFEWLVGFINMRIKSDFFDNVIGLLDIYGFEAFATNSLEQLCINYANERLQQYYVAHFLESLQKEYTEECLQWVPVDYSDNRPCITILDGRASVFSLLNEEVYLNRKTDDEAIQERLVQMCESSRNQRNVLRPARRLVATQPSFFVQHYAGEVQYSVSNLVTKNKDDIPVDLISLLKSSNDSFINQLFSSYCEPESPVGKKRKTVLTKFKSSLDDLLRSMEQSDLHYIRCLKPNTDNAAGVFQPSFVLQQLRACGTIETVNICRRGYPARMAYCEFQQRYSFLLRSKILGLGACHGLDAKETEGEYKENICDPLDQFLRQKFDLSASPKRTPTPRKKLRRRTGLTQHDHARKVCGTILQAVTGSECGVDFQHQFGLTKIFLTENQLDMLENTRLSALHHSATMLQSAWRALCCRRQYQQRKAARKICLAWLTFRTRREYMCLKKATVILQKAENWGSKAEVPAKADMYKRIRGWLHRCHLGRQQEAAVEARKAALIEEEACSSACLISPQTSYTTSSVVESSTCLETSLGSNCSATSPAVDGNLSDDSGVMVHEPIRCRPQKRTGPRLEAPEKRRRLLALAAQYPRLQDIYVGDGLVTRRRIPQFGCRFHTKASVLRYSHMTNRRDMPSGLPDAIALEQAEGGSSVDP